MVCSGINIDVDRLPLDATAVRFRVHDFPNNGRPGATLKMEKPRRHGSPKRCCHPTECQSPRSRKGLNCPCFISNDNLPNGSREAFGRNRHEVFHRIMRKATAHRLSKTSSENALYRSCMGSSCRRRAWRPRSARQEAQRAPKAKRAYTAATEPPWL